MSDRLTDLSSMSPTELDERLAEIEAATKSTAGYLANTTKAYKRVRQMRGADAHRKGWEFEAQMKKHESRLASLEAERASLEIEKARRT